jgi:hypothetical protein
MYIRTCIDRLVLVALSAQPPGVNELCVCVCVCIAELYTLTYRAIHTHIHTNTHNSSTPGG